MNTRNQTKKSKKSKQRAQLDVFAVLAGCAFLFLLCIVPLYVEHAYFNMLQAKMHVFLAGGLILCLGVIPGMIKKRGCIFLPDHCLVDYALLCFAGVALLSALLSEHPVYALFGHRGWGMGAFTWCMIYLLYRLLSAGFRYQHNLWLPVICVNIFIFFMCLIDSMGVDILGFRTTMDPSQIYVYLSTLGGINWVAGYLCLTLPVFAGFYIINTQKSANRLYLPLLVLMIFGVIFCASDSIYLGLGVCMVFALLWILKTPLRIKKCLHLGVIYGLSLVLVSVLPVFEEKRHNITGVCAYPLKLYICLPLCVACLAGVAFCEWWQRHQKGELLKGRWQRCICCAAGILVIVIIAGQLMHFDDHWGSGRGEIWRESLCLFVHSFSWKDRLLGVGPELLREWYGTFHGSFDFAVASAHNAFLDVLLTEGFLGLTFYILLWGRIIAGFIKNRLWERQEMVFFLPLMACLAQSLVNSWMVTNAGVYCVMLALYVHAEKSHFFN